MTPIFCCGFECGVFNSAAHFTNNNTASISTTTVRTGSRSLRCNPSGLSGHANSPTFTASNIWVWRVYIYFASFPGSNNELTVILPSNMGAYYNSSNNKIYAGYSSGGITLGTTGVDVVTGRWYRLDVSVDISNNPRLINVKVDGVPCSQLSFSAAATTTQTVYFGTTTAATCDMFYDDVIISNTLADFPIGPGTVLHHIPTSDGAHNVAGADDFERSATGTDITNATTTAYQLIDDVPLKSGTPTEYINLIAPPNATDYVEVVFGPASGVPMAKYAPRAVDAIIASASQATTTNNLRIALNDNGTTNDIRNATVGSTTVIYNRKQYATPPTGGAWTVVSGAGNFNNIRMRCYTSDANPDPWWCSAMIEAEFAEWPQKITQVKQAVNRSNTY